jgi:hypothetical protein
MFQGLKGKGVQFEHAWQDDPTTCCQPIIFPSHLQEIDDMMMWVRKTICNHQVVMIEPIDEDLVATS